MEKFDWPEVVGQTGEEAEQAIKAQFPDITTQILPEDSMVTMDFNEQRVRIFVNNAGKVVKAPQRG